MPLPVTNYVPQLARPGGPTRGGGVSVWLAASAAAWSAVGLIASAPLLAARGHGLLSLIVYRAFLGLCHQQPERSFMIDGRPLAVCARCAGVYAGFAACLLLYPLARDLRRTDTPARAWLALALLPTALDFLLNAAGLLSNTHLSRALTGAVAGAGVVFFVLPGLLELGQRRGRRTVFAAGRSASELPT